MLAPEILKRRIQLRLTQRELARLISVTVGCVAHFEKCHYKDRHYVPDDKMLRKLVAALFPDHDERETALAQWQYFAMVDLAQIQYEGFVDRMRRNGIAIDLRQRMPARRQADHENARAAQYAPRPSAVPLAAERKEEYNAGQPTKE